MFCPFISPDFILDICGHDFQSSAGTHSLSLDSLNLSNSSGTLSPSVWLNLISLFTYCSLAFLLVLNFPLICPSRVAFPGAFEMVLSRPFKCEHVMEQISSSCPQKHVSLGFEERSVFCFFFLFTLLVLIPSWTYVNVDCKAPTKYNESYSLRENRWGAREKHRCDVCPNTSLKVQGCLFSLTPSLPL